MKRLAACRQTQFELWAFPEYAPQGFYDAAMILETMLQRLFASLVHGPSMNARPHRSRQRCDWMDLLSLQGLEPASALKSLLEKRKIEFPAKVPVFSSPAFPEAEWSDEQKKARDAFQKQSRLLKKLRDMADDAMEYMNDHGESCLALGFPLISMPPAADEKSIRGSSRVLAPLLLMPVSLQVRTGSRSGVTLECMGEGADLLVANPALIAWLERQTGKALGDLYLDDEAADPWREVDQLLQQIHSLLDLDIPTSFHCDTLLEPVPLLEKLPKGVTILPSAVLGLFPLSNQSLLRDTRWMQDNQTALQEPVSAFLNPQVLHETPPDTAPAEPLAIQGRNFAQEWLVSAADPCQANAVLASREARALVVHGPPGTGKSQTITNMVADHLARGERVLFVCDKRTALDVVKYRLDAVGLGDLCGVVHDPSSDRKDFYMGLRGKLENLADQPAPKDPRPQLESVNRQLSALHQELEGYRKKIHFSPDAATQSFHDLLGAWLEHAAQEGLPPATVIPGVTPQDIQEASTALDEICRRAEKARYPTNPFRDLLGIGLTEFLARSSSDLRTTLEALQSAAEKADSLNPGPLMASLDANKPLLAQASLRESSAHLLRELAAAEDLSFACAAATLPEARRQELRKELSDVKTWMGSCATPLDRSLVSSARSAGILTLTVVNQHLAALKAWEAVAGTFFKRLLAGAAKQAAAGALMPLGLGVETGWQQGKTFYQGVKSRLLIADWLARITGASTIVMPEDKEIQALVRQAEAAWELQALLVNLACAERLAASLESPSQSQALAEALEKEARWAQALHHLTTLVSQSGLFRESAPKHLQSLWLSTGITQETTRAWLAHASSMEDMVRLQHTLAQLPSALQDITQTFLAQGVLFDELLPSFMHQAVENVLRERLHNDPELAAMDGERIEAAFDSYLKLSQEKLHHVGDYIRFLWLKHQRSRLLATTGSQLNKHGAALRQRLYVKGKKALKLRQMLATGADVEGGDPLFDLCPVWMASPSTVAQIFPRQPIFDVVIFDEASQCRLEEALPVLLRGHRVVIAGDQKQLPPTRFFESTLADSSDSDAETAEELFYQQQQEAEDLLTAALNLDVREAYLDVHYRSRNEALIGFSNEHYYGSRLQPIPGHPRNKALNTPIRLHRVNGVYLDRANVQEAEATVNLIAELLATPQPPSIGVACFNLTQREAIHEALANRVTQDAEFAQRYEVAKNRKGRDSFEGLFVKNLENVQGDERDVMIICTTFGPDPKGKFRRNFGALSQREGGRRLNVLVTRARDAVHVLTSIPTAEYTTVEATPPGQLPNGRLQLYAYLRYAEKLAEFFTNYQEELEKMRRDTLPELKNWDTSTPSPLATAFGKTLLEKHQTGSHVHWGNEGFCVDVACIHPLMPADVTVGVLTDFTRFHKTPDPIEWDLFRTRILRAQGWELQRLWSPVLFRRSQEMIQQVKNEHDRLSLPPDEKQVAAMVT
ncbi:AAA domain-containing protein [Prosthecobacter sp. SYSU 5D2]